MTQEIQEQEEKLRSLEHQQARFNAINKAYRDWKKNPRSLAKTDLTADEIRIVETWVPKYSYEKAPVESWRLSNLSATIRNTKKRIEELTQRHTEAQTANGNVETEFEGGKVIYNYDIDRVQIDFDSKPQQSMIDTLKRFGFKFSHTQVLWQRQLTANAKGDTDYILKIGNWSPQAVKAREEAIAAQTFAEPNPVSV